ncbi:MAG: tRNA 2-thiouridine(34) synthase MnmA [Planctomycetota bacterium]|nr:tRNA 2-thiouridine(34) synthase MnmA [Planctomycetota bacterium]
MTPSTDSAQQPPTLVIAMSGGVDSSVAAMLLAEAGFDLIGLFMRNGIHIPEGQAPARSCCSLDDARDARMVADALGFPFQAVDLAPEFAGLIEHFVAEYGRGRTPNPCLVCNRDLKFRRLLELADEFGAEGVATGHYARLDRPQENGSRPRVRRGLDHGKDQSYQLFAVAEEHLARTHLPLGDLQKSQVRERATAAGLRTSAKPDSQEICFVPGGDYRALLEERGAVLHPGELVDTAGRVLGSHAGTEHFTIGQRRGHGVAAPQPLYVVDIEPARGRVVLGCAAECAVAGMVVEDLNWIGFTPPDSPAEFTCAVQHRHLASPTKARITLECSAAAAEGESAVPASPQVRARVEFLEPVFSVCPGQGAAFYGGPDGDQLLGGGWIRSVERRGAGHMAEATGGG